MTSIVLSTNSLAIISSLVAAYFLIRMARKLGGEFGNAVKFLVAGIFFAVFLHSVFEFIAAAGLLTENLLMILMGTLVTIGSVCFIIAGIKGKKALE